MAADLTMGKLNVNVWTVCYNMDNVTFIRAVSTIDLGGFCMIFSGDQSQPIRVQNGGGYPPMRAQW